MQHSNHQLQIERILFFSDAVIAIAITLLIIEIKAPELGAEGGHQLQELIPKFIAFLISFFVIAIYWKAHHQLFGFVTGYTDNLIWLNTLFLLSIVLMPFTSAFYSENFMSSTAYTVYCLNIIITGLINCWLVQYIASGRHKISTVAGNKGWRKYYTLRGLVPPFVFLVSLLVSYASPAIARFCFLLIFPLVRILQQRYGKSLAQKDSIG